MDTSGNETGVEPSEDAATCVATISGAACGVDLTTGNGREEPTWNPTAEQKGEMFTSTLTVDQEGDESVWTPHQDS